MPDKIIHAFPFVFLRSPLQSLDRSYSFPNGIPLILEEGLYLSSPEFLREYDKIEQMSAKERVKADRTLTKYWIRSCSRCTPFGTFAGGTLIDLDEEMTDITVNESNQHIRRVRIDMNYMAEMINAVLHFPVVYKQIKFVCNNTLYEVPSGFRFVDYNTERNGRKYHLTSIEKNGYIISVLQKASGGVSIDDLVDALVEYKSDVNREEAESFIIEMWNSHILVPELEPCITGGQPLDRFIQQLERLNGVSEIVNPLKEIQFMLHQPKPEISYYQGIERLLRNLDIPVNIPKSTIQTDLFLSCKSSILNKSVVDEIVNQCEDLLSLSRPWVSPNLEKFKRKFSAKYEDAEMPLEIVLDPEMGIGYGDVSDESAGRGELIDNLDIADVISNTNSREDHLQRYSLFKYSEFLKNGSDVIQITENELNRFRKMENKHSFANSMFIMGSLMKSNGILDSGHFSFQLSHIGGPSACNLLGRFAYGDDRLRDFARDITRKEEFQYPDAIYAEIVHLQEARMGNVLLRPILRNYEIPYAGVSGIDQERQIFISDLRVSIRNGTIILRSEKHGRRIFPRLSSALLFGEKCLPIYRFLCELQLQGTASPAVWDLGQLEMEKSFPRVIYKDIIIAKARWHIDEKDVADLPFSANGIEYFREFRKKWKIPQRVLYKEIDSEMLIDFEHEQGIDLLLSFLAKYKSIKVEEFLFTNENCIVRDAGGKPFTDQIIIPVSLEVPPKTPDIEVRIPDKIIKRKFSINSEWLYFKIYCGLQTAEKLLKEILLPFVENGIESQLFKKFFFVRYKDDFPHLRIRFFNTDTEKQSQVQGGLMQILQPLLDNGLIDKISIDTYNRELERYSNKFMEGSESLFYHDSLAVLKFIDLLDGDQDEKYRMIFALRGTDMLLDDFGLSLSEKKDMVGEICTGFFKEFGGNLILKRQLNERFRRHQKVIFSHMDLLQDIDNEIQEAVSVFELRSELNRAVVMQMLSELKPEICRKALLQRLPSYIHMNINRLFIGNQRRYELVIYHFLEKYYTSRAAQQKWES